MYRRAKIEVARGERRVQRLEFKEKHLLPLDVSDLKLSVPPSPVPVSIQPLSTTSATEKRFEEPPRRQSSSFTEQPVMLHSNLGSIKETLPGTPSGMSPLFPPPPKRSENKGFVVSHGRQHRRRYSGSVHVLGPVLSPRTEYSPEGIEKKTSWE